MQSKLVFANNVIISSLLFFLIIDLYFLVLGIFAQIFNPIVELTIPLEILTKEAKALTGKKHRNTCTNCKI